MQREGGGAAVHRLWDLVDISGGATLAGLECGGDVCMYLIREGAVIELGRME